MINLARETLYEVVEDIAVLLREHYRELARNQEHVALNPDWGRYALVEASGGLRVYTARKDDRLVGYSVFFTGLHPHYRDMVLASNDVLFLSAQHRTGRTGIQLLEFCERELASEFAKSQVSIAWHAKENTPLERILKRRGYGVQDIVLTRLLLPTTGDK